MIANNYAIIMVIYHLFSDCGISDIFSWHSMLDFHKDNNYLLWKEL